MKTILEALNEATQMKYHVAFIDAKDNDGTPISATILVDRGDAKNFESFLEDNQGEIFEHAEGGNVEY